MNNRITITFLILVLTQALHSVEGYLGRLWEVLPPARLLSSLVSGNLRRGFAIINIGLFILGVLCWLFLIRRNYLFASGLIWFWIVIEMINGIGHPMWVVYEKAYVPGIATAPFLLIVAVYLACQLLYPQQEKLNKN
jgi:Protein of unknown function with HXXEE motif